MVKSSRGDRQYMGEGGSSGEKGERVSFVSRRRPGDESLHHNLCGALGDPLPNLRDRSVQLLLLLTALLQVFAWSQSNGYQLADSVEFMDRAYAVAHGQTLDTSGAVRSFGFSTLLLPFFAIGQWLELENMRVVVHAVRILQMALGLGLVLSCTKLGARLGGRQVGHVAGYFVAINPVFLQYSTDPVSGIAAALFISLGLNILLIRREFWHSVRGGLLLGLAFIMAYQTILVAGPLILLLFLRDRLKFVKSWGGAALGMLLTVGAQVILDKIMYDSWGLSIRTYLIENTGGVSFTFLAFVGLGDAEWVRRAYESYVTVVAEDAVVQEGGTRGNLQSPLFYLRGLSAMLVYPVMAVGLLGLARAWLKMNWVSTILVLLFLINAYAMSLKGSKSFRLWLPLLPMLTPLCAWGWGAIVKAGEIERPGLWRRGLSAVVLMGGLVLGILAMNELNTRRYGAYWDAMDFVSVQAGLQNRAAAERGEEHRVARVGSAYNWAVFCRGSSDVEIVKFRQHLDQWHYLDLDQRASVIEQLGKLDWLLMHSTIFPLSVDLTSAINSEFEVVASFWNEDTDPTLRDIRVLRRLQPSTQAQPGVPGRRARRLWEVIENVDTEEYRRRWQLGRLMPRPALFVGKGLDDREERLQLLGFEYEVLPNEDFGWITYHWYSDTGFDRDYVLVDRISTRLCPWAWQNNRVPGYGALPTSLWEPDWIVRESYLLVPGSNAFQENFKPFGGAFRRGDMLPALMWVHGESPPPDIDEHRLRPADPTTGEPLDADEGEPWSGSGLRLPNGHILSGDELGLVARFLIPRNDRYSWPDDGRPGPDDAEILADLEKQRQELEELIRSGEAEAPGDTPGPGDGM